jgi:adenylate kinase
MVRDRLSHDDANAGFLLDGYPRTVAQVEELDAMLGSEKLDTVLVLTANTDEVVARLLNRAHEQGRADDTEDVIRRRLEVYEEQTAPLIDVYTSRGSLVTVDGLGTVDEVSARIFAALNV